MLRPPDSFTDPYFHYVVARTRLLLGNRTGALDELEGVMRRPFYVTAAWLRIDPNFAVLHSNPHFDRLTAGT